MDRERRAGASEVVVVEGRNVSGPNRLVELFIRKRYPLHIYIGVVNISLTVIALAVCPPTLDLIEISPSSRPAPDLDLSHMHAAPMPPAESAASFDVIVIGAGLSPVPIRVMDN